MAKQFEKTINCKYCKAEIGVFEGKWYNVDDDTKLHFIVCPNAPHKEKGTKFSKRPDDLVVSAIVNDVKVLQEKFESFEETLGEHEKIIQGLIKATAYETGTGKKLRNPEDVQHD